MPYSTVQTKTAISAASGTAIACTFDTPPTEGSLIFAVVMHTGTNILPDSSYGPYRTAVGNINVVYHFFKMAVASEPAAFTVTSPASVTWAVSLREYTADGEHYPNYVDADATKPANNSSYTMGPADYEDGDLAVVSLAQQGGTARTATTWSDGFIEVADLQPAGTVVAALAVADQVMASTGTVSCTLTLSGNTSSKPSTILQTLGVLPNPYRARAQQQAQAGW
jgi:hypothetical protein